MMVNMGEGVMENANLHLNRFGIPTIPGSAIKGCARRMALQALHDWVDHINDPDESLPAEARLRPHPDDLCAPCCESFTSPADMLAAIARVFGWVQSDWEGDASDLRWAVHNEPEIISAAKEQIRAAAQFAGTVAFIEAQPKSDPGIELDVLTPHHTKYHNGEQGYDDAPDTEDPVPVYFPAVRPQSAPNHYIFPILPLPRLKEGDLASAEIWLLHGLELFGIGAKTAAGYGCYEAYEPPEDLGDYENEDTFKNRVLDRLSKSGEYPQLKKEIEIIKGNPKNARWIPILRERARADNNTKKRLKKTDWFPKEWISSETTP
ncbi:MAG: type III-B CRISPR module RAMP protein Cmr6 [Akkermansiaceae bacterium]|nr:type III-B CRISPR module RAMP protein Cmr6 [Akkermansiaceae bacterium]